MIDPLPLPKRTGPRGALGAVILMLSTVCYCPLQGQTNSPPVTQNAAGPAKAGRLLDLHFQSKDRMFQGQIEIVPSWKKTSLRFVNVTTGQDLGIYKDILENMTGTKATVKIYNHQSDIFSAEDQKESKTNPLITQQPVVFFKDDADPMLLHFASTCDDVGKVQVRVIQEGKQIAYGQTTLTPDAEFSALIDSTDKAISGPQPPPTNQAAPAGK